MSDFQLVRLEFHEVDASPGFAGWLEREGVSLAFTNGGRLFFVGRRPDGSLEVTNAPYGPCTAVAPSGPDSLFLATRYQIWRLDNALPRGQQADAGHDRLFIPQTAWTTGLLGVHDLALGADGRPVFVNSRFSCLSTVSERLNFEPLWLPPFVSALASEDRCHLTGLATEDGRPAYVTCAAAVDTAEGWRPHRAGGGVVVRVSDGDIVCHGLSVPHSPRLRDGRLWLANGGAGELGVIDVGTGRYEPVAELPGFCRGLALHGRFAVVGASKPPRDDTFEGLAVQHRMGADLECGVFVVDLETARVDHQLVLRGGGTEVFDVAVLPGARSPVAVAMQGDDVQDLVTVPCPPP